MGHELQIGNASWVCHSWLKSTATQKLIVKHLGMCVYKPWFSPFAFNSSWSMNPATLYSANHHMTSGMGHSKLSSLPGSCAPSDLMPLISVMKKVMMMKVMMMKTIYDNQVTIAHSLCTFTNTDLQQLISTHKLLTHLVLPMQVCMSGNGVDQCMHRYNSSFWIATHLYS